MNITQNSFWNLMKALVFVIIIFLAIIFLFCAVTGFMIIGTEPTAGFVMAVTGVAGNTLLLICCLVIYALFILKPIRIVERYSKSVITENCTQLTQSIAKLAQGRLGVRLAMKTEFIDEIPGSEMNRIIHIFNDLNNTIQTISREFNTITDVPCSRLCFVGADTFVQGQICGDLMGKSMKNQGRVAISTGFFNSTGLELRRKGFASFLKDNYPGIKIVKIVETREDADIAHRTTIDLLSEYPDLAGIYVTEGASPPGVAKAVMESGKTGAVSIISHDLTDDTFEYVRKGVITATVCDNTFTQGYDPVMHLYNHLTSGWKPSTSRLLVEMEIVTRENCTQFWKPGKGMIESAQFMENLTKPVSDKPGRPLKIAVLGCENSAYWMPVKHGMEEARRRLKDFDVTVDWIAPKNVDLTVEVCTPIIETFMKEKYDAIAMIAEERDIVHVINRAVKAGIPVITFITEPISLRGFLTTVTDQSKTLLDANRDLLNNTTELNKANEEISAAMDFVSEKTENEKDSAVQILSRLKSLLSNIQEVSAKADETANSSEKTSHRVNVSNAALQKNLDSMKSIEEAVGNTGIIVDKLRENSDQIDKIVEFINDITSQVNLLAINASIEAIRAGVSGKGFMVVSREIGQLAANTAGATGQIVGLVKEFKAGIQKAKEMMHESLEMIEKARGLTDETANELNTINGFAEEDKKRMLDVASAIMDIKSFSSEIQAEMEKVVETSDENSRVVEKAQTATQQITRKFRHVIELATSLEDIAKIEQQLLAKFTYNEEE
ncbi:MAG: substrate-binding domain-containing protein [Spirochaetales bacterium]|nr:substrate-binding domain-containing protein [Spirochaetales bacterium]